jgi:hypothetical protein
MTDLRTDNPDYGAVHGDIIALLLFYLAYPPDQISETLSRKLPPKIAREKSETLSRTLSLERRTFHRGAHFTQC